MLFPRIYFLREEDQLLIKSFIKRWTVEGPGVHFVMPFRSVIRRKGITLGPVDYLHIKDTITGELSLVRGPKLHFLGETEKVEQELEATPLKHNQYVTIIDKSDGSIRVEKGESLVVLQPTEQLLHPPKNGINIDEHTAVVVRDTDTGQLDLITEPQVFIPTPTQEVVEVRQRIRLEDHQIIVIKDEKGQYNIHRGEEEERSFFIGPFEEPVTFRWSTGLHKEHRDLNLTHIDMRPKFMWYEFEARTQDNVELILGITFFWQIIDVEKMIQTTDDTPGDICSHARSVIIQAISQVTLDTFLASFNDIIRAGVLESEDKFYENRGVELHAVEVRSVSSKDEDTQQVLKEIIIETTNRLNRLQKQESENEVLVKQLSGQIEAEEQQIRLLEIKRENAQVSAQIEGEAEALRVKAFLDNLSDQISTDDIVLIFNTLRKQEMMEKLSQGSAQLYYTPADIDLSIENHN